MPPAYEKAILFFVRQNNGIFVKSNLIKISAVWGGTAIILIIIGLLLLRSEKLKREYAQQVAEKERRHREEKHQEQ